MRTVTALAALLIFTAAAPAAQKRPDFTGTWVEDETQRKSPQQKPETAGMKTLTRPPAPVVITQTPEQITIERTFMSQTTKMSYDLNGRESVNRTGAQTYTTRTRWDGNRIVTEGTIYQITNQGETNWKLKEVRSMNAKGDMVVETTRTDEDGQARTVVRVFRKK